MEILNKPISDQELADRLAGLARRYDSAGSAVIGLLNMAGGQAENLLDRLPPGVRDNLAKGSEQALRVAMKAAENSRGVLGDGPDWLTKVMSAALGAAGGFAGLPGAMVELPVTTTVLLHGIQAEAAGHGFDPAEPVVQFDCVQVFAAAGPLARDDGSDVAFYSARLGVTGAALQALIARVAPRLAVVLGQKLAAQTVPVLGAAAGAAVNYAYASYYREMAHVHFSLRRLAIEADRDPEDLAVELRHRLARQ